MNTSLKQIHIKNIEDREISIDLLGAIIECIRTSEKFMIRSNRSTVGYEIPYYPEDVVYYNSSYIFIPEKLLEDRIGGDTYLGIEDMVNFLKNTRIRHKKILSDDFYAELEVATPAGRYKVDTLCFNYKPMARVIGLMGKEAE